jgi:hypothetical protein
MKKAIFSFLLIVLYVGPAHAEFVEEKKLSDNVLVLNANPMYRANLIAIRS